MVVTKEQVQEEAKKLGITLDDEGVAAYVKIGLLPVKEAGSLPDDDDDDDDDDTSKDGLPKGVKERLSRLAKQRRDARDQAAALQKKLDEQKKVLDDQTREEAEKKGEYTKLLDELQKKEKTLTDQTATVKARFQQAAVEREVESALLIAGVPSNRLAKALRLFDSDKVEFEWTDEEKFEYEIENFDELVETFKKENDFLFAGTGEGDENEDTPPFRGHRPPASTGTKSKEKTAAKLRGMFRSLR